VVGLQTARHRTSWTHGSDVNANLQTDPAGPVSKKPARSEVIAESIVSCLLIAVGTNILIAVMVRLNIWLADGFPWFIAPAFALSLIALKRSRRWYEPLQSVRPPSTVISSLASVLLGTATAGVVLLYMALTFGDAFMHGHSPLLGDQYHTTAAIRAGVSLTFPIMASFYEEAGVRGALQLHLQHVIGPGRAEMLAGVIFVALHGFAIAKSPWQLPFLALTALVNGRLAAVTQTVRYPVVSHAASNGILLIANLVLRGMNT